MDGKELVEVLKASLDSHVENVIRVTGAARMGDPELLEHTVNAQRMVINGAYAEFIERTGVTSDAAVYGAFMVFMAGSMYAFTLDILSKRLHTPERELTGPERELIQAFIEVF
jgi:hypothetical protein